MGNEPLSERFYRWLAWRLPRSLVKWCAVRLMAHATFILPSRTPDDITIIDMLGAWDDPEHVNRHWQEA